MVWVLPPPKPTTRRPGNAGATRATRRKQAFMPNPLERHLKATAIRKFKALHAQDKTFAFRKRHGSVMTIAGDPDFYGLWRGLHWELELKAPGAKPSPLQDERRQEWARAGAATDVASSPEEVDAFIQGLRDALYGS